MYAGIALQKGDNQQHREPTWVQPFSEQECQSKGIRGMRTKKSKRAAMY
jgi:hypothetical protein